MKKQKTEMKKRMQMQIEVKKENIEESDEGKPSKKMNLCTWSLEIKIEALWDKNRSFRRNNKRALKKQKTKIKKHIQMQIEVKKENIEESDEGKPSKKTNLYPWNLEIKIKNGGGSTATKAQEHKKIEALTDKARKPTSLHGVWKRTTSEKVWEHNGEREQVRGMRKSKCEKGKKNKSVTLKNVKKEEREKHFLFMVTL